MVDTFYIAATVVSNLNIESPELQRVSKGGLLCLLLLVLKN